MGQVFDVAIGNTITPIPGLPGRSALETDSEQVVDAYRAQIIDPVRELLPPSKIAAMSEQLLRRVHDRDRLLQRVHLAARR